LLPAGFFLTGIRHVRRSHGIRANFLRCRTPVIFYDDDQHVLMVFHYTRIVIGSIFPIERVLA
jgi:5-keto 4-deoxyuronate isomerase